MKTYILLFRGINVGGRNILPMKALTLLLEQQGFTSVRSYIQSGNIVLQASTRPGDAIGSAIETQFGFRPEIMVLDRRELEAAAGNNPYASADGKSVHFYFADRVPAPDPDRLAALASGTERFALDGKVFYLYAPDGIGRSRLVAGLEKCLGVPATGRNLNTVNKLLEMARDS